MVQASDLLVQRLADLLPGWQIIVRAYGGTAQCDWTSNMIWDAEHLDVKGVVIAFSGNDLTSCITGRPYLQGYTDDANWADTWWTNHLVAHAFVNSPGVVGTTPADRAVGNMYAALGQRVGAPVADAVGLLAGGLPARFQQSMPCLVGECSGYVDVRSANGTHLCDIRQAVAACPATSSGVVRFVEPIVHAVASMFGLAQPPFRQLTTPPPTTTTSGPTTTTSVPTTTTSVPPTTTSVPPTTTSTVPTTTTVT